MWLTFSPLFCFSSFLHISQYRLLYHQSVYCIRKRNSIHLADTYLMTEKRKRNKLKKKNTSTIINSILYSPFLLIIPFVYIIVCTINYRSFSLFFIVFESQFNSYNHLFIANSNSNSNSNSTFIDSQPLIISLIHSIAK